MYNYQRVVDLSNELVAAVEARNELVMQQKMDALEVAYGDEFGDSLDGYEAVRAYMVMNLSSVRYFSHNNMFRLVHERYKDVSGRLPGFLKCRKYSEAEKDEVKRLFAELKSLDNAVPERHQNMVVNRNDTRCCLCRVMPANKTGSHMVPNFLAHPTFSWDGKGKRFHEALNHCFLNDGKSFCTYYGREVPDWRFAKGEGKEEVTEADIEKNINQLEFDNEFCSRCENRFGVLESAYSQFYNGQQKKIHPRVAYLFWLSVLWRMSMGSMGIFMDVNDELSLRKLLDENMLDTAREIAESCTDLGKWRYVTFRAEGLKDGDRGIFGSRKESAPYVVMYHDLVMVFYHSLPSDEELTVGPISVKREMLNDWHSPEKSSTVDRRWFWNVRDWIVESSYEYYDPAREKALILIREEERSRGAVISDKDKAVAIEVAHLAHGFPPVLCRLRKMERIFGAWCRLNEAKEKGETYDPLADEELFLCQRDFDMYYKDLAALSKNMGKESSVEKLPFYEQARQAIPADEEWTPDFDEEWLDDEWDDYQQEPYVNPLKHIGRNDPCPCGSGLKYKKCCGKR